MKQLSVQEVQFSHVMNSIPDQFTLADILISETRLAISEAGGKNCTDDEVLEVYDKLEKFGFVIQEDGYIRKTAVFPDVSFIVNMIFK